MEHRCRLEILMGMIASGKSTYCRKRALEGAIIVNDDSIVTAMHGGNYALYDKKLKPLYKSLENTAILTAAALGRDVVVDRPGYSRSQRRRYIRIGKSLDMQVAVITFPKQEPMVHAERRFNKDSRGKTLEQWLEAAERHAKLWQIPNGEIEGFDILLNIDSFHAQ